MDLKDSDHLRTRLYAIDMRLAELDHEMRQTQIRVNQLESELENSRLAGILGESAGVGSELKPELERSRGSLERQREIIESVKKSQRETRVQLTLIRARERQLERSLGSADGETA